MKYFVLPMIVLSHTGEKPFACTVCEYRAAFKSSLTNHMRTHTGEKPFACTKCEYRAAQKCLLTRSHKAHAQTHRRETIRMYRHSKV